MLASSTHYNEEDLIGKGWGGGGCWELASETEAGFSGEESVWGGASKIPAPGSPHLPLVVLIAKVQLPSVQTPCAESYSVPKIQTLPGDGTTPV